MVKRRGRNSIQSLLVTCTKTIRPRWQSILRAFSGLGRNNNKKRKYYAASILLQTRCPERKHIRRILKSFVFDIRYVFTQCGTRVLAAYRCMENIVWSLVIAKYSYKGRNQTPGTKESCERTGHNLSLYCDLSFLLQTICPQWRHIPRIIESFVCGR